MSDEAHPKRPHKPIKRSEPDSEGESEIDATSGSEASLSSRDGECRYGVGRTRGPLKRKRTMALQAPPRKKPYVELQPRLSLLSCLS